MDAVERNVRNGSRGITYIQRSKGESASEGIYTG